MSRVRLILVALLFCCAIHVEAKYDECSTRLVDNPNILTEGRVKLSSYTYLTKGLITDQCFKVVCGGNAFPHRRIIWYRLVDNKDNSSGEPIASYWSKKYYYDTIVNTTGGPGKISSSLIIPKFNKAYMGNYYCIITNGEDTVKSPMINIALVGQGGGFHGDRLGPSPIPTVTPPPPQPLLVQNIKAVIINDSNLLISWNATRRNEKFCRIFREEEEDRKEVYTWTLQVLEWPNYTALANNTSYEDIITGKYFSSFKTGRTIKLKRSDCRNMNYLYRNISSSFYYKFQMVVEKHRRGEKYAGKTVTQNGSYIHHFGELTPPKILYPTPLLRVCKPFDLNICKVTGNPLPRVRLYQPVQNNDNIYGCLAENVHLYNSGEVRKLSVNVEFSWDINTCTPTEASPSPPQPSCARPSSDSICGRIFSQDSMVYVPGGSDINRLEQRAEDNINQLKNSSGFCYNQMVKLICYSFLAPCYMDAGKPTSVCPESCQGIMAQCHSTTFNNVLENLPEWSPSRNCSKSEAISNEECIHLSIPSVERENFTDGSCVIGRGSQYTGNSSTTGCISWDDRRQIFFDTGIFTELKSAGASCRNPGGSKERPWCYVNLTSGSLDNWKYCDVPKCPWCKPVPEVCRTVYNENVTVHVNENSYPVNLMQTMCFSDSEDRCYKVWNAVTCHLAYPQCMEADSTDSVHSFMPLCKSYCERIKTINNSCQIPSSCDQSHFIHQLNCSNLPEENCINDANLDLDLTSDPLVDPGEYTKQGSNHQLAISIYVAAAVCMFSVFTIVIIIIGYCCCLYGHESTDSKMVKPLSNPLDHPVFANMKMHCIDNPDYVKTSSEKDSTFAFKSLRPISKSKIHYIRDLGSGNFGLVYQGKVEGIIDGEEFTMAAIKTLREGTSAEGMKNFLHEAKLACQFDHENIIKLYGICMSDSFYCLVFEYMDLGDLNEFLRSSASSLQRRIMNPLDSSARSRTESSLSNNPPRLNPLQLVTICHQIALGMEYFASLNHVHRDLATRNCLVGTGLVVKIGDFGMSQTLYHSDYYKQKGEQALPVRWMAPEAFIYGRFSTEGDVWSFGVVMWEVFSFAMQPYYGKMNDQVMNEVRRGHTLSRPDDCPESIFEIMRSCWQMEPHRRPSFSELAEELSSWKPTRCSTSTALESQGSTKGDDSLSLASIQDKDLELSVFDEYNMSGTEEDIAN